MKPQCALILLLICLTPCVTFCQEDTSTVIDKLSIFSSWFAEGIKLNNEPDFGGYERIDIVKYTSRGDSLEDLRETKYQVQGLIGLKLLRAEPVVNLGFPRYGILIEYSWTNSQATPRDYFRTAEILQIKGDSLISLWKYNTSEDLTLKAKTVRASIDFWGSSDRKPWNIVVTKREAYGIHRRKTKNIRETYRYRGGKFELVKIETIKYTD